MNCAQVGRCLFHAHAILQACDRAKKSAALICGATDRHRQDGPKLRWPARTRTLFDMKLKTRRHHADDGKGHVVERDWLPYHTCLTTEATLPQSVTEHCNRR